jgi:hypothetical protein
MIDWDKIAFKHGFTSSKKMFLELYASTEEARKNGKMGSHRLSRKLGVAHTTIINELKRLEIPVAPKGKSKLVDYKPELFGFRSERSMFLQWRVVERLTAHEIKSRIQSKLNCKVCDHTLRARFARYGLGKVGVCVHESGVQDY